jgi:transmembrane sensor
VGEENFHMDDDLLVRYLLDEADAAERIQVEQWLSASEKNIVYFKQFEALWQKSRELASLSEPDEEAAWERFRNRIREPKQIDMPPSRFAWMRIAALLVIFFGAGWLVFRMFNPAETNLVARAGNTVLVDTLPDGSVITLNRESELTYPSRFKNDIRSVRLRGEAFFDVKPDPKKPFIVQVNDVTIRVLGTSFNVRSVNGNTEVIVETGKVEVTRASKKLVLLPKEKLLVRKEETELIREKEEEDLYNYYRTKSFVCDRTPLWKLVNVLNEAYHVRITIEREELRRLLLTTTFHNESLDQVLEILRQTFDLEINRNGETIIIR